jgi:hypothetical protein
MEEPLRPIMLPDTEGPGILLQPNIQVWREIEAVYGPVGSLLEQYRLARPHVSLYHDLLFKCARAGGCNESYADFAARLYRLGFYRLFATVGQVFNQLIKEPEKAAELEEPGGKSDPLA